MLNKMLVGLMLMALAMLAQPVWAQHDFSKTAQIVWIWIDSAMFILKGA